MRKILFIYILGVIFSCVQDREFKEFYLNGSLKFRVDIDKMGIFNGEYEEYYNTGELKEKGRFFNGQIVDTVYNFYKNKKLKSKGLLNENLKIGWWFYYKNNGNLKMKNEYLNFNDSIYKNQTMSYNENGEIDLNSSSFFEIEISDTIDIGKSKRNIGKLRLYNSNFKNADKNLIWVVIENRYPDREVKKDTFNDGTLNPRFGVFGYKEGKQKIKGLIIEEIFNEKIINKDSTSLRIRKHKKYFEKEVYVKK